MSAFTELWSQIKQPGQPAPYMLIDCAGVEGGAERLPRDIFDEFECLFTGDLAEELEDVAPYLGRLASLGPEAQAVVEDLLARHLGILVTLPPPAGSDEPPSFSQPRGQTAVLPLLRPARDRRRVEGAGRAAIEGVFRAHGQDAIDAIRRCSG